MRPCPRVSGPRAGGKPSKQASQWCAVFPHTLPENYESGNLLAIHQRGSRHLTFAVCMFVGTGEYVRQVRNFP